MSKASDEFFERKDKEVKEKKMTQERLERIAQELVEVRPNISFKELMFDGKRARQVDEAKKRLSR